MSKRNKPRPYDASRRRQRAEESRERTLEAARRLFAERGYAETTVEEIAAAAGLAVPTLYAAFQSKRGLLSALLARLISGQPGSPPLLDSPGARAVLSERDPRALVARFAADLTTVQERVIPIYQVMQSAARSEPEIAEMLARAQDHRFDNIASVAARLAELGALRPGLTSDEAARTIWAIASPEVRQLMIRFAGWSTERYATWLEKTLAASLLAPAGEPKRR